MNNHDEIFRFLKRLEVFKKSEHFKKYKALRESRLFLYPIRLNFARLIKEFNKFHTLAGESSFWSNETPYIRWKLHSKLTTYLFNYLTTIVATVELSRRFAKNYLNSDQLASHANSIKNIFINNARFSMLHELRNYVSHFSFLQPGFIYKFHYLEGLSKGLYLSTMHLLEYDGWTDEQKTYIKSLGESFDIEKLVYDHQEIFLKTQDAMYLFAVQNNHQIFHDLVDEMEELLNEGRRIKHEFNLPFRKSTIEYIKKLIEHDSK